MTFEEWWDTSKSNSTPDTYKGWEESCRQAWEAGAAAKRDECVAACSKIAEQVTYQTDAQGAAEKCEDAIRAL